MRGKISQSRTERLRGETENRRDRGEQRRKRKEQSGGGEGDRQGVGEEWRHKMQAGDCADLMATISRSMVQRNFDLPVL